MVLEKNGELDLICLFRLRDADTVNLGVGHALVLKNILCEDNLVHFKMFCENLPDFLLN